MQNTFNLLDEYTDVQIGTIRSPDGSICQVGSAEEGARKPSIRNLCIPILGQQDVGALQKCTCRHEWQLDTCHAKLSSRTLQCHPMHSMRMVVLFPWKA